MCCDSATSVYSASAVVASVAPLKGQTVRVCECAAYVSNKDRMYEKTPHSSLFKLYLNPPLYYIKDHTTCTTQIIKNFSCEKSNNLVTVTVGLCLLPQ